MNNADDSLKTIKFLIRYESFPSKGKSKEKKAEINSSLSVKRHSSSCHNHTVSEQPLRMTTSCFTVYLKKRGIGGKHLWKPKHKVSIRLQHNDVGSFIITFSVSFSFLSLLLLYSTSGWVDCCLINIWLRLLCARVTGTRINMEYMFWCE